MPQLPLLSGKEIIKILAKIGYYVKRQKGSHVRLHCDGRRPTSVPVHKIVDRGTVGNILDQAGLSDDEFIKLIKS